MQLLAFGDRQLALDPSALQIDLGRNQREPLFPDVDVQLFDLPAVQQQFPIADRRVVLAISVRVLADVGVDQPCLVAEHGAIGLFELDLAVLGGLHFGAGEDHPGFEAFHQKIVVARLPVVAQDFDGCVSLCQFFISTRGSPIASMSLDGPSRANALHLSIAPPDGPENYDNMSFFNRLTAVFVTALLLAPMAPLQARTRKGDKYLAEGRAHEAKREWDAALEAYEKALSEDPPSCSTRWPPKRRASRPLRTTSTRG